MLIDEGVGSSDAPENAETWKKKIASLDEHTGPKDAIHPRTDPAISPARTTFLPLR
jgi:hypothetical protein